LALIGFVLLDSQSPSFLIILCLYWSCVHFGFTEIGFVLHKTLKMVAAFLPLTTDYTDERGFGERVYVISHLPIFSSTHKPLAYLLDIYYTRKAVFSQANSRQNLRVYDQVLWEAPVIARPDLSARQSPPSATLAGLRNWQGFSLMNTTK
jgi:hypothetical protein